MILPGSIVSSEGSAALMYSTLRMTDKSTSMVDRLTVGLVLARASVARRQLETTHTGGGAVLFVLDSVQQRLGWVFENQVDVIKRAKRATRSAPSRGPTAPNRRASRAR